MSAALLDHRGNRVTVVTFPCVLTSEQSLQGDGWKMREEIDAALALLPPGAPERRFLNYLKTKRVRRNRYTEEKTYVALLSQPEREDLLRILTGLRNHISPDHPTPANDDNEPRTRRGRHILPID